MQSLPQGISVVLLGRRRSGQVPREVDVVVAQAEICKTRIHGQSNEIHLRKDIACPICPQRKVFAILIPALELFQSNVQ